MYFIGYRAFSHSVFFIIQMKIHFYQLQLYTLTSLQSKLRFSYTAIAHLVWMLLKFSQDNQGKQTIFKAGDLSFTKCSSWTQLSTHLILINSWERQCYFFYLPQTAKLRVTVSNLTNPAKLQMIKAAFLKSWLKIHELSF